jgi:hypothetical protein
MIAKITPETAFKIFRLFGEGAVTKITNWCCGGWNYSGDHGTSLTSDRTEVSTGRYN